MSITRRVFAVATAMTLAGVIGLSAAPSASAAPYTNRPTLTFNSGLLVLGGTLKVVGKGFVPNELITVTIDANPAPVVPLFHANPLGGFTIFVTFPGANFLLGVHTVKATGQFAHDGYDVAANSVIVVLPPPLITIPLAYQHPLPAILPIGPTGEDASPFGGMAVEIGIALAALAMVSTGAYVLIGARRRQSVR